MAGVADKNALKAGLFIVASLALAIVVYVAVRGAALGTERQSWTVRFSLSDDISGLSPGAEVRIGGVKQGTVDQVELTDDLEHVLVGITLPQSVALRQDPQVAVQSTVTGVSWLNFSNLGTGEPIEPGSIIEGDAGTFSNLVAAANELAPAVTDVVRQVRSSTLPELETALGEVQRAAGSAADVSEEVRQIVGSNRPQIESTLANLNAASERLPRLVEQADRLVSETTTAVQDIRTSLDTTTERLNSVLEEAQGLATRAQGIAEDTSATAREIRGLIAGNRGKIEQIIEQARDASRTLSLAASEIRRSPWRLLYRPSGEQRRSLDLYDSARQFAQGAAALQDASVALSDLTNDPTADPERVRQLLDRLEQQFVEFERIERQFFQRLNE